MHTRASLLCCLLPTGAAGWLTLWISVVTHPRARACFVGRCFLGGDLGPSTWREVYLNSPPWSLWWFESNRRKLPSQEDDFKRHVSAEDGNRLLIAKLWDRYVMRNSEGQNPENPQDCWFNTLIPQTRNLGHRGRPDLGWTVLCLHISLCLLLPGPLREWTDSPERKQQVLPWAAQRWTLYEQSHMEPSLFTKALCSPRQSWGPGRPASPVNHFIDRAHSW